MWWIVSEHSAFLTKSQGAAVEAVTDARLKEEAVNRFGLYPALLGA